MRVLALLAILLAGCQSGGEEPATVARDPPPTATRASPPAQVSAEMRAMPPPALRLCRASRLLRPVCPRQLPAGAYPRCGFFLSPIGRPGTRYDVLELNGRRRVVLLASRYGLGKAPLAEWPSAPKRVRWGEWKGELALLETGRAPLDRHLIFRWRGRRRVDYAVAVRVWKPRAEAVAALRAIVLSIPK